MSLPMIISMGVNSLYNIVDSYFVAKIGDDAMTALSLVYPIQNLITSIAVGFGVGINAMAAFYLGAKREENAYMAATQGLLFNIIHGLLLTIICIFIMPDFIGMFSKDSSVIDKALVYSNIAFLFSPVITAGISFEKIFQSVGNMRLTCFCMITGFITNIILDPLMIFGIGPFPKMGMSGAAWATGIGQCVTLVFYILTMKKGLGSLKISLKYIKPDWNIIRRMYGIGVPATLNMALPSLLISVLNGILVTFSESYVLVLGVYYKLQTFIYLMANGLVQGIRPIISYNNGAGEKKRVHEIYRTSLIISAIIMLTGTAISWLMPKTLFGLFTRSSDIISKGETALHIISLGFVLSAISVTASGALEGLGKGMASLWISLLRYVILIIPFAFILSRIFDANGVWLAFAVTELLAAMFSLYIYRKSEP